MYGHHIQQSIGQPDKVASPARGQLNRENGYFPVPVCAREFGHARRVRPSRLASACSSTTRGLNLVLNLRDSSRFPRRRPFIYTVNAIESVPSLSDYAIAYRWRSLPRGRRHRAISPRGSSSNGICLFRHHRRYFFSCASLFPHPLLVGKERIKGRVILNLRVLG